MRSIALIISTIVLALAPAAAFGLPRVPKGLPHSFQLGADSAPGDAAAAQGLGLGMRDLYLPGPVNGPGQYDGWQKYEGGGGRYLTNFVNDTVAHGQVPVLTYYAILQSLPGGEVAGQSGEQSGLRTNLTTKSTMKAYWKNAKLMFRLAGKAKGHRIVIHVEPDQWGYLQGFAKNDNPKSVKVVVGSSGVKQLKGLPDNARGFAQAFVRLRDKYAKNVLLGYHVSQFGAGHDLAIENADELTADQVAQRLATFYKRLKAKFDVLVGYMGDRDAGEAAAEGNGAAAWDAADFQRDVHFVSDIVADTGLRIFDFQVPYGNTKMRAMNNTDFHWQDTHLENLLAGGPSYPLIHQYAQAGMTGILFGIGQATSTCPCDKAQDGTTDPLPINGNNRASLSADDDGGYFREQVRAFADAGPVALP